MNRSNARALPVHNGYIGQFRPVWRATYETVTATDATGETAPVVFPTEAEAETAAWRTLRDISEPIIVCTGPLPSLRDLRRGEAEKQFRERAEA